MAELLLSAGDDMTHIPLVRILGVLVLVGASDVSCASPRGAETESTSPLSDPELMRVQREVWEVWYAGDTTRLRQLTPGLIAINNGEQSFSDQEAAVRGSAGFHSGGGRLLQLSFPEMRVQRFGDVAIVYSTFRSVALIGGDTLRQSGRATEVFVRQNGKWLNPGWHLDSGQ